MDDYSNARIVRAVLRAAPCTMAHEQRHADGRLTQAAWRALIAMPRHRKEKALYWAQCRAQTAAAAAATQADIAATYTRLRVAEDAALGRAPDAPRAHRGG